jgi:hypothetical protein
LLTGPKKQIKALKGEIKEYCSEPSNFYIDVEISRNIVDEGFE